MDERPWDVVERETVLDASPWLRLEREHVRLPDGREIPTWWIVDLPPYAMIVAVDDARRAVAVRHYKHGLRRVHWSLPAGYIEPGEEPLDCAKRELLEETGYVAERWTSLGAFGIDGNRGCGEAHLFLARGIRAVQPPDSGDLEEMQLALTSLDELIAMARSGELPQITAAAAVAMAALVIRET